MALTGPALLEHMGPRLELLEAHAPTLREECLALSADDFRPLVNAGDYGDDWGAFPLMLEIWQDDFVGLELQDNRARCPRSTAVLDRLPGLVMAGFMRLAPYGYVKPHHDRREDRIIRAFLALQLPPQERTWWRELTTRLLDVRITHQAWNDWDRPRHVLCCDFRLDQTVPTGATERWTPQDARPPERWGDVGQ
jgi:beta-hydroxylase